VIWCPYILNVATIGTDQLYFTAYRRYAFYRKLTLRMIPLHFEYA